MAIRIGTWPIEPGQSASVVYQVERANGAVEQGSVAARWRENRGPNSYWEARLGPFTNGDRVRYAVSGRSADGDVQGPTGLFVAGPRLYLAILWHQHQPIYRDTSSLPKGSYLQPWVRLHAIRDYYSMAALVAAHPNVHLTINLTPSLLWQLDDYVEHGATDRALELTLLPAERLTLRDREAILSAFFDADWHHQIFVHPRYAELFQRAREQRAFGVQDMRDLQMWFNLAWFGQEFRDGPVRLATGEVVDVRRFVDQGRGFALGDVAEMVAEQYKILRAIVLLHRQLQDAGQLEVSTTPFSHPILPLLVDTDAATIDRPGATRPRRFAHPEDAEAHVRLGAALYEKHFGRAPRGMPRTEP